MTPEEYDAYARSAEEDYAQEVHRSGLADLETARKRAADTFAELLPDGLDSPRMHLWTAVVDDEPVGLGWIELREGTGSTSAYIFNVELKESARGRGLGRQLMLALHEEARSLGATSVGLNVFGHNTVARTLYESLGYVVTAQNMKVDL
jgi:ribosomal protein S18 acetylase RimI-like enzyme